MTAVAKDPSRWYQQCKQQIQQLVTAPAAKSPCSQATSLRYAQSPNTNKASCSSYDKCARPLPAARRVSLLLFVNFVQTEPKIYYSNQPKPKEPPSCQQAQP